MDEPVCADCGAPHPDGGPPRCPECGEEARVIRGTAVSRVQISSTARGVQGTPLWPAWARRAISGFDDLRANPPAVVADADALVDIALTVATAVFALEGARLDLEASGHIPAHHQARVNAQQVRAKAAKTERPNAGDFTAATFLDALGRPADTGGWQSRMGRLVRDGRQPRVRIESARVRKRQRTPASNSV